MAVFVPVAVLASGFFASSVSAAAIPAALPIIDPSYVNNGLTEEKVASILNSLNNLDEEKLAKLPSFLTNGKFWEGALTTVGAAAGGIGAWLGVTGGKRSIEDLSDDDKMAALGALLAQSGALNDLDGEKLAKLPGFLTNGKFWEGALTTVGAAAGGIGAWLGVTGGKRSINDLSDDDKMAALGALMAQSGALDNLDGEKLAKLPSFLTNGKFWEGALTTVGAAAGGIGAWLGATGGKRSINDLSDDDKIAALGALMAQSGALDNLDGEKLAKLPSFLTNGKFWEGALTTVGAAAGGIGAWLGATGGKRSIEELSDEDKEAALKHLVPAIVSAVGGFLGLGAGAYQHHQNGQQKRSIDELNDEDKEAALKHLIPAIATAVSGFLGLGAGAYQHHQNGQKRSVTELSDEDKEAAFKHLIPAIAGAVSGLLGLGAGAYQHHQNGQKRSVDELSDEDKEAAFKHLIPAIAGAVSGLLGLGAGAYQHHKNGQQKRSINPEELSALFGSGKRSEDSALLARMLDSEFY